MQKCCSFEKEQQNAEVLFLRKGTTKMLKSKEQQKCESAVHFQSNNKNAEVLFLLKGTTKMRKCCFFERNNKNAELYKSVVPLKGTTKI